MPGDFSRNSFRQTEHYGGVLKQQGRVDLDVDWNEQIAIQQHRTRTETKDVIGACGVPKKGNSFRISVAANGVDLLIAPGHIYIGGLLCESENVAPAVTYFNQPYYPDPPVGYFNVTPGSSPLSPVDPQPVSMKDGTYIVYVDAWQREINYLDDPLIHEVALGEADTAVRLQNVWQVKLLATANAAATCETNLVEWNNLLTPHTGKLNVKTITPASQDPCILPPGAGYRRLENQLYRVEVQRGGNRANTTFKWSRDNASVETIITGINGSVLTVINKGRDEVLGFANGQWVEIVDDESTLKNTPRKLIQILSVDPAEPAITLASSTGVPTTVSSGMKLRRWDQSVAAAGADGVAAIPGWIEMEDGIQLMFSEGTYRAGDYWLIPARTATGDVEWPPYEIPNLLPLQQPPLGIHHHYCKIAILHVQGGIISVEDCRPLFPSLTEICAEDICFDNNNCNFPDIDNVQEALDMLCSATDLRAHNKLLHGFGVICGLKVKCRATRTGVIIENGNALDCEGNMIQLKNRNGLAYEVVEEAKKHKYIDERGNGTVCLSIARGPKNTVVISQEKFVPQNFWDTVLEGSLLKDFYDECIKNLVDFLRNQFSFPIKDVVPVPVAQRRITAFINLFGQLINSASGPYAFISGKNKNFQPDEDMLLREFYDELKGMLASETFCAMNDNDHPFPAYEIDPGLETIFGPAVKFHSKLRLHPDGNFAYTCGNNNNIYAYNLVKHELIQIIAFPAASNIVVQDIAVSTEGRELFAVGIIGNKDSVFAIGKISDTGLIKWGSPSPAGTGKFVSLAVTTNRIFAIGKSQGLFEITGIGTSAFDAKNIRPLNATGLFNVHVASDLTYAIVAVSSQNIGIESSSFNRLSVFNINSTTSEAPAIQLQGGDTENDIIVSDNIIYATGNNQAGARVLVGYDIVKVQPQKREAFINDSASIRLANYTENNNANYLLLSISDKCKVLRVAIKDVLEVDGKFCIPVQLFPMSMAINNKTKKTYVLNMFVNTLTVMDMPMVFHAAPAPDYTNDPPYNLSLYRDDIIEAYKDLLSHLLQYLKDCFCDKFLIDCNECDENDKVYLGCVEVRNGKVYHICNFSKRKYVKSFHTVEYWLSTVPVLPIIKEAFTKFCCTVLDTPQSTFNSVKL